MELYKTPEIELRLPGIPPLQDLIRLEEEVVATRADLSHELANANTPHRAVALWWSRAVLHTITRDGPSNLDAASEMLLANPKVAIRRLVAQAVNVMPHIPAFTEQIELLSRELGEPSDISVDYHADRTLMAAASRAGMDMDSLLDFPAKTYTLLIGGKAIAGYRGSGGQRIWPPPDAYVAGS